MPEALTPCKLLGVGLIYNVTDDVVLSTQAEFGFGSGISTIEIPDGDSFNESSLATKQTYSGRFGFRDLSASIVAAMISGTTATGSTKHISKEAATVGASPYTVTLTKTPYKPTGATYAPMEIVDETGHSYKQVTTVTAQYQFSVASTTVSFNVADASKNVFISYFWADVALGVTVKADPTAISGNKTYLCCMKLYPTRLKSYTGYMTALMTKCQRSGDVNFGTTVNEAGSFGFDFKITVINATDFQISFENN